MWRTSLYRVVDFHLNLIIFSPQNMSSSRSTWTRPPPVHATDDDNDISNEYMQIFNGSGMRITLLCIIHYLNVISSSLAHEIFTSNEVQIKS